MVVVVMVMDMLKVILLRVTGSSCKREVEDPVESASFAYLVGNIWVAGIKTVDFFFPLATERFWGKG